MNELRVSSKKRAKIKLALEGCSGSGKTYSALLLAFGLTHDWSKIAVIDSENGSADLYANLGPYNVLTISDYNPETYIDALNVCAHAGMEVIIVDSISQSWDCLLEQHASMAGNSFTNWSKITPRQNDLVQRILNIPCHVICTMRTKQDYVLAEKNGKMVPEKVGLKAVMRDESIMSSQSFLTSISNTTQQHQRTGQVCSLISLSLQSLRPQEKPSLIGVIPRWQTKSKFHNQ